MIDVTVNPECPFSVETFDLLSKLKTNSQDFYIAHEEEFKKYVENPVEQLSHQVAAQLPDGIIKQVELKNNVFPGYENKKLYMLFLQKSNKL